MLPVQTNVDTTSDTKAKRKNAREKRQELIDSFFEEIDSRKIETFTQEESFQTFLATLRNKAVLFMRNSIKVAGNDKTNFKAFFPYSMYRACLSQFTFERKRDVKFRYHKLILISYLLVQ